LRDGARVVEYRESRPREIDYYEEPRGTRRRSVSVVRERDVVRGSRGSFGGDVVEERRSVRRVGY
jgi:hypothetical protein